MTTLSFTRKEWVPTPEPTEDNPEPAAMDYWDCSIQFEGPTGSYSGGQTVQAPGIDANSSDNDLCQAIKKAWNGSDKWVVA